MRSPVPALDAAVIPQGLSRRSALKLLSANIALLAAGCGKPPEEIVPYVHMPERLVPGIPLQFASTLPLGGYGRGVICTSIEGRPIKVSGNELHPASLGATDVFAEAAVFSLYDPDRSQSVRRGGEITSWLALQTELVPRLAAATRTRGRGLRILTGPLTSPTAIAQIGALRERFPDCLWHVHDVLADVAAARGAVMAFGRPVALLPRWGDLDVLVTLGADPLGPGPNQIRNGRGFIDRRRVRGGTRSMLRSYALECVPTLSGANADNKLVLPPFAIENATIALARHLGAELPDPALPPEHARVVAAIAADLQDHMGRGLLLAGPGLRPEIHALVHWVNARLRAPLDAFAPATPEAAGTLEDLARDLEADAVELLLIAGCNPAYDAPATLKFADLVKRAGLSVHLGTMFDETAAACAWHAPESHPLESWSDLRSVDGVASLVQPLIRPFYDTKTIHGMLAALAGNDASNDYETVRTTWEAQAASSDFETLWRRGLQDGIMAGSATPPLALPGPALPNVETAVATKDYSLSLRADPSLWDGSFANNAWLQECPKPLTKEVWGNSLGLGAEDAKALGVTDGDLVRLSVDGRSILAPVRVASGHAIGAVSLALGYGRTRGGSIGTAVGVNAYELLDTPGQQILQVTVTKEGGRRALYSTQEQFALEGEDHDLFPTLTLAALPAARPDQPAGPVPTFLPLHDYGQAAARWAMVIDTGACIGCNACVVACQVENNVPVVGPEEIARHRDMHWLRIDRYELDGSEAPRTGFQPVPCMHCETAPCEPVCPVAASVHDSEGLNVQVYNRCIGTRFCEANCPYKVRRFNFFGYADDQTVGDLDGPAMRAHNNPDVTVRSRGVMEKCTYCVQRISGARRRAEKESRPLGDRDVVTACQSACPTRAIAFGNLNAAGSTVGELRQEPHHYTLLDQLNTKPRTTYLAAVRNPNPDLARGPG